jgi:predicted  nucleic acid-binding Zn-ribbon protein
MGKFAFLVFAASLVSAAPAFAAGADVEEAVALMKQSHADQCQKKKIQVQLLLAHQHHDQDKLNALGPELEAINKRLKPTEDKLAALKAKIKKNPDDAGAFETALLQVGDCE